VQDRKISFDWKDKRRGAGHSFEGLAAVTRPYMGGPDMWTVTYAHDLDAVIESDILKEEASDMPDYVDNTEMILGGV
jgi:hypothetical protein